MPRRGVDLTEEQWSRVKAQAARRRQTISQFLGDVVDEILPDGSVRPAVTIQGKIDESHMEGDTRVIDRVTVTGASYSSRPFSPAPKPGAKK